jgi:uncharacterized protein YecT (DUF1311 family)
MYSAAMASLWSKRLIRGMLPAFGLCIAAGFSALAQERTRLPDAPCHSAGSVNHMTQCLIFEARKNDRELERMSRALSRALKPEEARAFDTAQTRWYPFREANCVAERDLYTELSTSSLAYAACAEALTRQRVEDLKIIYAWLFK